MEKIIKSRIENLKKEQEEILIKVSNKQNLSADYLIEIGETLKTIKYSVRELEQVHYGYLIKENEENNCNK